MGCNENLMVVVMVVSEVAVVALIPQLNLFYIQLLSFRKCLCSGSACVKYKRDAF